jgi:hypothetical protein
LLDPPVPTPEPFPDNAAAGASSAVYFQTAQGEPRPDDQFLRFGVSMKVPGLTGEDLLQPTVQTCVDGSQEAWIDSDPEANSPAPRWR